MGNPSDVFQRKVINPSPRNTAQWAGVPAAIRVSSFFSATVENVALLNRMHSLIDDYLHEAKDIVIINGTPTTVCRVAGKSDFIKQMRDFMQKEGMPMDATDNNITNLASHRRLALVFDTNIRSAYGQARWETAMTDPMRKAFPAWRFVRHPGAKKPRPLHKLNEGAIRLKDDFQFWAIEMNSRHIGGFELPWPPFGFNSWMDLESVPAKECQKLGLIPPNYTPPPLDTSAFGASPAERILQKATSTKSIKNPKLAALLKKKLAQNLGHPPIEQGHSLALPTKQIIKTFQSSPNVIKIGVPQWDSLPGYFYSDSEANEILRPLSSKLWLNIDDETKQALFDYTLSSSKINEYLREFSYSPLQSRQVKLIKKALNKTKLPLPMIVQRGIKKHPQLQKLLNIEPKQINNINLPLLNNKLKNKTIILKEKAFTSCRASLGGSFAKKDIIFFIKLPKGCHAAYLEPFSAYGKGSKKKWNGIDNQDSFSKENEILIKCSSKFQIIHVDKKNSKLIIYAKLIK